MLSALYIAFALFAEWALLTHKALRSVATCRLLRREYRPTTSTRGGIGVGVRPVLSRGVAQEEAIAVRTVVMKQPWGIRRAVAAEAQARNQQWVGYQGWKTQGVAWLDCG